MTVRKETGTATFLYGGNIEAAFQPTTDSEWAELGRMNLEAVYGMFGIADSTLQLEKVWHNDLSAIGTTDKVAVNFRQEVNGVPVLNGGVSVVFDTEGRMLAVQTPSLPGAENVDTNAIIGGFAAIKHAHGEYVRIEGREATQIEEPELAIYQHKSGKSVEARLAWAIEMRTPTMDGAPSGRRMYVAADRQSGEVLGSDQLIHEQGPNDIGGNVRSWTTPGLLPDTLGNPEALEPMKWMNVTSSQGNATTDTSGNFVITNASSTTVTATYTGTYARVVDQSTSNHSASALFTQGIPGQITMNGAVSELVTAQANAYARASDFHAYVRSVDAGDGSMDFQILCNSNLNSNCNAFYDGSSVNFYTSGGGCPNTAFSTVVAHEIGHWANDVYSTGNGSSGIGEGMADVWAMFQYDDPVVGQDFCGTGCVVRTGTNTRQWCGTGCYGQVHADGEVIMGALWKARRNLNTTYGNAAGDAIADALNLAWFQDFNQTVIAPVIEDQWLVLDDDDGNLANGTPNFGDINDAFVEQGFPGVDLPTLDIVHTPLSDTQNNTTPYAVNADVTSLIGANITTVQLKYSVNGGAEQTVNMSNTGGDTYSGNIPAQSSPDVVNYHIEADDDQSNSKRLPASGDFGFFVGVLNSKAFFNFEPAGDEGWTHGQIATQDDWMHGSPNGSSTDPGSAYSGTRVWGNDLAPSGFNGAYQNNVSNWLDSPSFNCAGSSKVFIRFQRWLNVEESEFDQANIKIDGVNVWTNPFSGNLLDSDWTEFMLDVSAQAANDSDVTVRFDLMSDGGVVFGGWNIDDFEILELGPVGGPVTNTILLTGPTSALTATIVMYDWSGAPANSFYDFMFSKQLLGTTINGQPFDIGPNIKSLATGTTSPTGTGSYTSPPIPNRFAGRTAYLEVRVDDVGTGDTFDSNFVQLDIF